MLVHLRDSHSKTAVADRIDRLMDRGVENKVAGIPPSKVENDL